MEIHPPEHPIRSLRAFATHILTTTISILIALGLEQLVERHRNHLLAENARANFAAELARNAAKVEAVSIVDKKFEKYFAALMPYLEAKMAHPDAKISDPDFSDVPTRTFLLLPSSAWDEALATQAMPQLSFAESRALTEAYSRQAALNLMSDRARDQWLSAARFGEDIDKLSAADLHDALQALRVGEKYLAVQEALDASVLADYRAAQAALLP